MFTKQLYGQPNQIALTDSLTKQLYGQPHQAASSQCSPNSFTGSLDIQPQP